MGGAHDEPTVTTDVDVALAALRAGSLVAIPTETVYGLGADASDPDAVARIFVVKGRPSDHPLIVHLGARARLDDWATDVDDAARRLADAFWPGPLTLLLRRSTRVPDAVTGGRVTVGLRVPDHPLTLELLDRFGGGVAAPSANRFGRVSPTTANHVVADLGAEVEVVLDGGPCRVGVESTIVDLTGPEPVVLREGGVPVELLAEVLGSSPSVTHAAEPADRGARAPGMLVSHYAPAARVVLTTEHDVTAALVDELDRADGPVGVLAPAVLAGIPAEVIELEPAGDASEFASVLYDRLRQADRLGLAVLVCIPPAAVGVGAAVVDRLRRAAAAE